jgi:hypothetical protein
VLGRGEVHTGLWCGGVREIDHLLGNRRCEDTIKMDLQKWVGA